MSELEKRRCSGSRRSYQCAIESLRVQVDVGENSSSLGDPLTPTPAVGSNLLFPRDGAISVILHDLCEFPF